MTGGTGLGLSISKALTELLGGKMRVESTYGKGSIFYFTVPYLPANKLFVDMVFGETKIQLPQNKRKIILVAEDEPLNFLYLSKLFASEKICF